jgi:hypothetical protein
MTASRIPQPTDIVECKAFRNSTFSTGPAVTLLVGLQRDGHWDVLASTISDDTRTAKYDAHTHLRRMRLDHLPYTWLGNMSSTQVRNTFTKREPIT